VSRKEEGCGQGKQGERQEGRREGKEWRKGKRVA